MFYRNAGYLSAGSGKVRSRSPQSHVRFMRLIVIAAIAIAGCQDPQHNPFARKPPGAQSQQATPEARRFETTRDPPINADTHFAAGQLAESQGVFPRAIEQYNEALKLAPNNTDAMFRLGVLYTNLKMFPEAVAMWQRYIKATKGAAAGYNNLAMCYQAAEKWPQAEQAFKAAIAADPNNSACRVNYGIMLARANRVDEAAAELGKVLKPAEVHYNLGAVYEQQGRKDRAKSEFTQALQLDPNLKDARTRLEALESSAPDQIRENR
jgi:tetratricopeptide (TPR) repeat protein